MKLKIYQINQERDARGAKFMNSDWVARHTGSHVIDPGIYDEVFSGEVDCKNLEEVYTKFNTEGHPLHRGHSLSVSDVVVTDEGAFFCESIGFLEIGFDESQTHKPDNLLKIVYVEPGRAPFVSEVGSGLKAMQQAVGGLIEPLYMGDGTILVCNDEAKLKDMSGNRRLGESIIVGPFFMVGDGGEDFRSLTDAETEKYMARFAQPEQISQQEVQDDMGYTMFFW